MMYAKKIKMKLGCSNSNNVQEIAEVYLDGGTNPGFFKKEVIHDYLQKNPNTIRVNIAPYPYVIPAVSIRGEKYVRSEPNDTTHDNLLKALRLKNAEQAIEIDMLKKASAYFASLHK